MSNPARNPGTGVQVLVLVAVLGVMLACVGGVGVAVYFALQEPAPVVENPLVVPAPQEKVVAQVPQPTPPQPAPPPAPPTPVEKLFQRQWTAQLGPAAKGAFIVLSDDGKHLFAQDGGGVRVFDAGNGTQTARLTGTGVPPSGGTLLPVGRDRLMLTSPFHPLPTLWHVNGTQPGEILPQPILMRHGPRPEFKFAVSPDARFVFVGSKNPTGGPAGRGMYQLHEAGSGQSIGGGMWEPGNARFAADGTRLFVAEPIGRCRWLKVPGGAQETGWMYPPAGVPDPLVSMSADGGLILYAGKPLALDRGRYLLDGKTGQILRNVSFDVNSGPSLVTADGRWLLGVSGRDVVVTEALTGTELLREPLDGGVTDVTFRADGRAFAAHDADGGLVLYTLRRDPPTVPPSTPPAPLSPVPDPLPPFPGPFPPFPGPFPQAGPFPMPGPVPQPTPGTLTKLPRPAAPPALKARWTAPADIGDLSLKPELGPMFTRDGSVVVQHGGTSSVILAYDAADGTPLPGFAGHQGNEVLGWVTPFADRVASSGKDGVVKVWMARTGAPAPDLKFPQLPIPGKQTYGSYKAVSPTGRYTAHARQEPNNGPAGQFRILDTTTGKDVIEGPWQSSAASGHISFTPDELRVFVVNGSGKAAWFKLPSGEKEVEWGGKGPQRTNRVTSVSADGRRVVFEGILKTSLETNVVDGRTGEVVRPLPNPPYQPAVASLSPDGALVAVPLRDSRDGILWHVDVMEVATGKKLGRVSPPREGGDDVPMPRFAPDGKSMAVTFRKAKQVALYSLVPEGP